MSKFRKVLIASAVLAFMSLEARADAGSQWTNIAAETIRGGNRSPGESDRHGATVGRAIALALAGTGGNGNGNGTSDSAHHERREAAVAIAAFAVLESLYPAQREHLDSHLALAFERIPETAAKAEGAALGRRIATEILATSP